NPGQESFFGRLKDECQDEFNEITDFRQLQKFIKNRMNYYNNKRIHTSISYQTPKQFTQLFINNFSLSMGKKRFSFFRG
ncbi:IS3 family transposase, partial [Patescibacteria group bacterium]|nr:IS3 family transposase [Patescibacteria group bacterium]